MEQIIRQYGKFLLEAAVVTVLMWLLFAGLSDTQGNRGILAIAGTGLAAEETISQRVDVACYGRESEGSAPAISYVVEGILYTGEYPVEEILSAVDGAGNPIPVRIESVGHPSGNVQTYTADTGSIAFDERGIYTLCASATDASNRKSVYRFTIPVNERR